MLGRDVMPGTLQRSSIQAQDAWVRAYDRAVAMYGEGQHARWSAYAALKRGFEKARDRWEPKSRERLLVAVTSAGAAEGGCEEGFAGGRHAECGTELLYLARKLGVERADELSRPEVVQAVRKKIGLASSKRRTSQRSGSR